MDKKKALTEQEVEEIISLLVGFVKEQDFSKWLEIKEKYGDYDFDELMQMIEPYRPKE